MIVTDLDVRERERLIRSAVIACAFWIVAIGIFSILPARVAVESERSFPSVMIRLTAQAPAASSAAPTPAAPTPAAPAAASAPAPAAKASAKPAAKPATKATATRSAQAPAASAPAPSRGLGIPDFGSTQQTSSPAGGEQASLEFSSEPVKTPKASRAAVSEFEGSVAVASPRRAEESVSSSAPRASAGTKATASDETSRSLSAIADSVGTGTNDAAGTSGAGTSASRTATQGSSRATTTAVTAGGASVGAISFTEGTARRLVHPANPSLALPDRLARLIDSNRAVFVTITVRADGSVPRSTVVFSPSALLPPEVRDYIAGEVSSWRFDRGTGDGQARFSYSIKVQ